IRSLSARCFRAREARSRLPSSLHGGSAVSTEIKVTRSEQPRPRRAALDIATAIAGALGAVLLAAFLGGPCIAAPIPADPLPRRLGPQETNPGVAIEYGSVVSARGHRVRTVTTRPTAAAGHLPVIVFIPWLSCDTVEWPRGPRDGWSRTLYAVATGVDAVLVRVDKPGVGDS